MVFFISMHCQKFILIFSSSHIINLLQQNFLIFNTNMKKLSDYDMDVPSEQNKDQWALGCWCSSPDPAGRHHYGSGKSPPCCQREDHSYHTGWLGSKAASLGSASHLYTPIWKKKKYLGMKSRATVIKKCRPSWSYFSNIQYIYEKKKTFHDIPQFLPLVLSRALKRRPFLCLTVLGEHDLAWLELLLHHLSTLVNPHCHQAVEN